MHLFREKVKPQLKKRAALSILLRWRTDAK